MPREVPFPPFSRRGTMRCMPQQDSTDSKESTFARMLQWLFGICVLVVFGSGPPRFPDIAGRIALWVMGAIVAIQLGREFLKGVAEAGGWRAKQSVKPHTATPDATSGSNGPTVS